MFVNWVYCRGLEQDILSGGRFIRVVNPVLMSFRDYWDVS